MPFLRSKSAIVRHRITLTRDILIEAIATVTRELIPDNARIKLRKDSSGSKQLIVEWDEGKSESVEVRDDIVKS